MTAPESSVSPPRGNVVKLNERDLLDYRAVQRTFDGAYARTAIGQLCYAIVILRLFQPKFFYVGLVYAILGMGFVPVAMFRYQMAIGNANRFVAMETVQSQQTSTTANDSDQANGQQTSPSDRTAQSISSEHTRPPVQTVLLESFVTAGSVVVAATAFVGLAEIALLVLILRL